MNFSKLNITGYSTALYSTWYFVEELGLLFDAGDGVSATLLGKSGKIKQVFISHADRDHLTGLLQFNQLNARGGRPVIHYPKSSGSFPAIKDFTGKFDPHVKAAKWVPIAEDECIKIKDRIYVTSIKNGHIVVEDDQVKSLSFKVLSRTQKLKEEYKTSTPEEIKNLSIKYGRDFITNTEEACILGYSGDTPVEDLTRWDNCKTLIHEATFLNHEDGKKNHANKHSNLEEVLEMVSEINVGQLILGHFSSRYSPEQIDSSIKKIAKELKIQIPIYRVLPGQSVFDILGGEPTFEM